MKAGVFEGSSGIGLIDRVPTNYVKSRNEDRHGLISPQEGRSPVEVTRITVVETYMGLGFRPRCHAVGDFFGVRLFR